MIDMPESTQSLAQKQAMLPLENHSAKNQPQPKPPLSWGAVFLTSTLHLGCLLALFSFSWGALTIFVATWLVSGLGMTFGWHRLLTHASFRTFNVVKYFSTLCGCLALQGSPFEWVGIHRLHHRDTDRERDPHSPTHSLLWAHFGWSLFRIRQYAESTRCIADLRGDRVLVWIDRLWLLPSFLLAVGLFWIGSWPWVLWGICVRTVALWHSTWLVNSVAHRWGYRNFATRDNSRNNWFVALITFGEGWHNNHHAQQRSAAHGMKWWEVDLTYGMIVLLRRLHLVWDVIEPDRTQTPVAAKLPLRCN